MSQLDLKYLQYAVEVFRCGSITRAAASLYLAQSNLSRAIGELERSLGFALFIRTKQGVTPTQEGEQFLQEAQAMLLRLNELAESFRAAPAGPIRLACVPSSLYVNTVLEASRQLPELTVQCQEYYDCRALFQTVLSGGAAAALITLGTEMRPALQQYLARQKLTYHCISQSSAYGVVNRSSPLYHPEIPAIQYEKSTLMLNVSYYEPIGIHFQQKLCPVPPAGAFCHGTGRAANLDRLSAQPDLVMLSCHVHSSVLARNGLAAVPFHPELFSYEYGFVTRAPASLTPAEQRLLDRLQQLLTQEICHTPA